MSVLANSLIRWTLLVVLSIPCAAFAAGPNPAPSEELPAEDAGQSNTNEERLAEDPNPAPSEALRAGDADAGKEKFLLSGCVFEGDRLLDEDEALRKLPFAPGDSVGPQDLASAAALIRRELVQSGFWRAEVTAERRPAPEEESPGEIVALAIDGGEVVLLGEIDVRGNRAFAREEILARMELAPGKVFEESVLRRDVERILRAYSEKGFALARVYPSHFERTADGTLSFVVRLSEGPKTEIESLRVFGEVETDERVIARVAGVRPGDTWNVRKIEAIATRLRREGLFERVGEPRIVRGSRDNRIGLEIELEEGPSNSLMGVLGYNPDPKGGGDLVGIVDVDLRNILGTARRARIRFESQPGDVKDISFRFREPWVLSTPISLEGGAAQARRDTLYSRTDLDLALSVPVRERAAMSVTVERRESSFDDSAGQRVSETSTGGSVGFTLDTRDRRVNPSSGLAAGVRVGARETRADELRTRLALDTHVLLPFAKRWVVSEEGGFRGVQTTGEEVPLYEQYFLGGTNTVRGYREEQFHGEKVFWLRSELRYRLSLRSRAYVFFDAGGYEFESGAPAGAEPRVSDIVGGGGSGIALETRGSGLVRFELAFGRGDGFSDAKVHVGLEQEF